MEFVEQNIENATDEELMIIHTQMLNRVDEETKKHQQSSAADLKPVEEADIMVGVECAEDFKTLCHEKTIVSASPVDLFKLIVPGGGIRDAEVNIASKVKLHTDFSCNNQQKKSIIIKANLRTIVSGTTVPTKIEQKSETTYEIEYTPSTRGRHQLETTVNGLPVAGSPYPVFVKIPPTQHNKPVEVCHGLRGHSITFNSRDELVFVEQNGDILFLDKARNLLRRITQHGFQSLFGVSVDDDDNVYVTDGESDKENILKFDKQCVKFRVIKPTVKQFAARGIAVFGDHVIVADEYNHQLLVFTKELLLAKVIDCQSGNPVGVACDQDGNMYVCNFGDNCIQVFNSQGVFIYPFSDKGSISHKLDHPHSICVAGDLVYVTEWGSVHCVSVFTKEGKFITSFGKRGSREGEFDMPSGLAVDRDGFLYVCDYNNSRIQVF